MGKLVKMECVGYLKDGRMECRDSGGFVSALTPVDKKDQKLIGKTVLVEADTITIGAGMRIYSLVNPQYKGTAGKNEMPHYATEIRRMFAV